MNPLAYSRKRYRRSEPKTKAGYVFLIVKISVLVALWSGFTFVLLKYKSEEDTNLMVTVMPNKTVYKDVNIHHESVEVTLRGAINPYLTNHVGNWSNCSSVAVRLEWRDLERNQSYMRSSKWIVYMSNHSRKIHQVDKLFRLSLAGWYTQDRLAEDNGSLSYEWAYAKTVISVESISQKPVGLHMVVNTSPLKTHFSILYAAILIIALYIMFIWELGDRTLCTLVITCAALATLTMVANKPSLEFIISAVDFESLMLLLGNMIMTSLMSETGFFDYLALVAYRISKGHPWLLIALLVMVVAVCSAFIDNSTVVLLFSPSVVRLCEAMALSTTMVLIIVAMYANIGGSVTPVGGPPNVIISTNNEVEASGLTFVRFSLRMLPPALICMVVTFVLIYSTMGKKIFILDQRQLDLAQKRREEMRPTFDVQLRIAELRRRQPRRVWLYPAANYFETLATLEASNRIRKKMLLVQSLLALGFAASCFILKSVPWAIPGASLGWISMLAAFLLLILADKKDLGEILARVKWGVMLFLASLFVLTDVLHKLGLIHWVGQRTMKVIRRVDESHQTLVAMLLILWLSALLSAVIDNAAVATIIVRLCIDLTYDHHMDVQLLPIAWATILGTSYGANGTLLGSCSNEFATAVARDHGYEISFRKFFVVGFPIMLVTIVICSVYLVTAHFVFNWH
ncbi:P protein [Drosophila biarmipes]|uniref:P protein n=1 Tax=Drosophila biarmipes TaxID=125945 RepID=UPI0007E73730|nr:P protein [Drosophila biarmipes]